jgi:hypothetical protein
MKERTVRTQDQISIPTSRNVPDILESSGFDSIDSAEFTQYFKNSYAAHKKFLLQFVASRTAFSTALDNVQSLIEDELGNSIEIKDKDGQIEDKIDAIYESSLRLYAIVRSTRFVPKEFRKEVILNMMEQHKPRPKGGDNDGILGAINGKVVRQKDINDLSKQVERLTRDKTETPYGKLNMKSRRHDPFAAQNQEPEPVAGVGRRFKTRK